MTTLFMLFHFAVLLIGLMLVFKHYARGWMTPPVLSGIAFILLALPDVLYVLGL